MDIRSARSCGIRVADRQPAPVAEVLNGKRSLTLAMIRRLHAGLGIPAEVLIQETRGRAA